MDPALNANQQADQTAYPYPAGVMPPEHEQTDTTGTTTTAGTSTETKALSPVQQAAEAGQDKVAEGQIALTEEQKQQKLRENAIAADIARRQELAGQGFANETEKAYADTQKMIDEGRARAAVAQHRLDNAPPVSYFHHGDTWGNVLRGFGLALGGVGDAMQTRGSVAAGHGIPTLDTVGQIVQGDLDRQRKNIEQMKDSVVMARTGIDDAMKARQQMLQDIELRGAAAYAQLERIGRARLAAQGLSQPEIDQHQAILGIQEKRAEQHAKYVEPLYQTISKHIETAKRKDEAVTNRTNAAMASKAAEAGLAAPQLDKDLEVVAGYQPGLAEKVTPRALLDPEAQKAEDASNRLATQLTAKLVGPRGAANPETVKQIREQYLPSAIDTPEARDAKIGALRGQLGTMTMGLAGRPAAPAPGAPATAAKPPAPVAPAPRPAAPAPAPAPAAAPPTDRRAYLKELSLELNRAQSEGRQADAGALLAEIRRQRAGL